MESSRRQYVLLLFLVLPVLWPAVGALYTFSISPSGNDSHAVTDNALRSLVSGPLRDQDLLLVTDNHSQRLLDVGRVVSEAGTSLTPVLLATQQSLLYDTRPNHHTRGSLLTALVLFYDDPTAFLLLLDGNKDWNPNYLVLFCLNPELNITSVLGQPVIQRSQFILLLQLITKLNRPHLQAYTSLPYQTNQNGRLLTKASLGTWNVDQSRSRQSLFPHRFLDFGGKLITVSALCYDEPYVYFIKKGDCVGGNIDVLRLIGDRYGFKVSVIPLANVEFAIKVNGTYTGMLGQMMYHGKDMTVNVLQPNVDRHEDFDLTYPYWETNFAFILRVPQPLPQWKNILYPFSMLMWGLLFVTMVLVSSSLALLLYYQNITTDPVGMAFKIGSGLLGQSMPDGEIRVWWARVWLVVWWVVVDVLAAAYTGNLVAVLTVPVYPARLTTAEDIADSSLTPVMYNYGSYVPEALRTSTNPTLAELGRRLYIDTNITLFDVYGRPLELVMEGTHTLIVTIDYLIFTQHRKKLTRDTYIMREKLYKSFMTWILRRNTPYTPIISDNVIRLLEAGILGVIYDKHRGKLLSKSDQVRGDGVLNLGHLQGAFIVVGIGLILAGMVLLLEACVYYSASRQPHKQTLN